MTDLVNVKGLDELQKLLDTLPSKMEANVMRGALRAGMKPVLESARSNVRKRSGKLAEGLKIGTRKRGYQMVSRLQAKGEHGYLAPWIEYGTSPHIIKGPLRFGKRWYRNVRHPGARPYPFMRPALDSRKGAALRATGEYIKRRLARKHGIDTSHINLEGDE